MPLADLLLERFKIKTRAVENPRDIVLLGAAPLMILANNPNRLGAVIVNLSANVVYIGLTNEVSATNGIRLNANGGQASLIWDEDFQMTAWAWWGMATAAASRIYVLENVEQ